MKSLLVLVTGLFCSFGNCQKLVWNDTLRYATDTKVIGIALDSEGNTQLFGKFGPGYSGNAADIRNYVLSVSKKGIKTFLDSTISGVERAAGPVVVSNHIYVSVWLNTLGGKTPRISGIEYPEGTYIVKYDFSGKLIWANKLGFHGLPVQMTSDSGGMIFVVYLASGGTLLYKFDSDGNAISHNYPTGANPRFDNKNNLYITGSSQIKKFDYSGSVIWSKYAANDCQIAVDDDGECYVSYSNGYFNSTISRISTDGNVIWSATLPIECMVSPSIEGDNLYVAGNYGIGNTIHGIEVSKLNPTNGTIIWSTKIPSTNYKLAVLASTKGHIYLSAQEWGNYSARVSLIEDLSYIPVTTDIPSSEKKTSALKVVPNPTGGVVRISYSTVDITTVTIRIIDASGRVVYTHTAHEFSTGCELDLSFLERGVYIVDVQSSGGSQPGTQGISRLVIH